MVAMQSELYSVYYAHIGIMGLAEAMRIEDEEEEAGVKPELALWTNFEMAKYWKHISWKHNILKAQMLKTHHAEIFT